MVGTTYHCKGTTYHCKFQICQGRNISLIAKTDIPYLIFHIAKINIYSTSEKILIKLKDIIYLYYIIFLFTLTLLMAKLYIA